MKVPEDLKHRFRELINGKIATMDHKVIKNISKTINYSMFFFCFEFILRIQSRLMEQYLFYAYIEHKNQNYRNDNIKLKLDWSSSNTKCLIFD
jgi:hypothetical protein